MAFKANNSTSDQYKRIPQELRDVAQWHVWNRDSKGSKIPCQVDGTPAKSNDPTTWTTFENAVEASKDFQGLAFELSEPWTGVDLDNCFDEKGMLRDWAAKIVAKLDGLGYGEISPSKKGLKYTVPGRKPEKSLCKKIFGPDGQQMEVYDNARFWCITGDCYNDNDTLKPEGQQAVTELCQKHLTKKPKEKPKEKPKPSPGPSVPFDDNRLQRAADAYLASIPLPAEGDRNATVFKTAGHLRAFDYRGQSLSQSRITEMLIHWGTGLDDSEVSSTVHSALNNGTKRDPKIIEERESNYVFNVMDSEGSQKKNGDHETNENAGESETESSPDPEKKIWPVLETLEEKEPEAIQPGDLPEVLSEICEAVARSGEVPFDMPAMLSLGIIATAAQRRFQVHAESDYREPLSLFVCVAMKPGERKTSTLGVLEDPLNRWASIQEKEMQPEIDRNRSRRTSDLKRIDHLRGKAAKSDDSAVRGDLQREIEALENELPPEIAAPVLTTTDCTPEHLATLMGKNGERISVVTDEGGIFEIAAGLYSSGIANLDIFLKGHAGSGVRVHRGSREPVRIDSPSLSFAICCQPSVLEDIGGNSVFVERGLLARFMFTVPKSNLGNRTLIPYTIPPEAKERWKRNIFQLLNVEQAVDQFGNAEALDFKLSVAAHKLWKAEQHLSELDMRPGGPWGNQTGWCSKYPGAVLRIAGVFHAIECVDQQKDPSAFLVKKSTMEYALKLGRKVKAHAMKAFKGMTFSDDQKRVIKISKWIRECKIEEFTKRDCARHCNSGGKFDEIKPAIEVLIERGWIRLGSVKKSEGRGRPHSQPYEVNPEVHKLDEKTSEDPSSEPDAATSEESAWESNPDFTERAPGATTDEGYNWVDSTL